MKTPASKFQTQEVPFLPVGGTGMENGEPEMAAPTAHGDRRAPEGTSESKVQSPKSKVETELKFIRRELAELKRLFYEAGTRARVDDLVGPDYVARRLCLSERTVLEGKAGTNKLPRLYLGSLVRFPRGAVDRFLSAKVKAAIAAQTSERVVKFNERERRRA